MAIRTERRQERLAVFPGRERGSGGGINLCELYQKDISETEKELYIWFRAG